MTEPASFCDLAKASEDLVKCSRCIWDMVEDVANARVIKEMHSERMKQALAKAIARSGIDSVAKGEIAARVDSKYLEEVEIIKQDLLTAEKTLAKAAAYHARSDGLRTLISWQKQTIKDL